MSENNPNSMMQVLIVEDSPAVQLYLKALIAKWGYDPLTASDGEEAWRIIQQQRVNLVVSDWMMPKLNGPELCAKIRAAGLSHYVYTILVTARGDSRDLVEGMRAGADDFLIKPVNPDELQVRIEAARRVITLEAELERKNAYLDRVNRELQQAQTSLRRDLEAAAQLQRGLLPELATVGSLDLQSIFLPAAMVAGDMFGHFSVDDQHMAFFLLDVAGHGVPSAMLSFNLFKTLTASSEEGSPVRYRAAADPGKECVRSPAEVVAELNRRFLVEDDNTPYFTIVFGIIDTYTGATQLCLAGQPHPYRVSRDGNLDSIGDGGFPVGLLPEAHFDNIELVLRPGDRLYLYTDGVNECASPEGEMFTSERLQHRLVDGAKQPLSAVLDGLTANLRQWRGEQLFDDDISMLALEFRSNSTQ